MKTPYATTYKDDDLGMILHLQNGLLEAKIAVEYGSNLISLTHSGREIIHTDYNELLHHSYTGCFVLYPFPNRIRDRKFTFAGREYKLDDYPMRVDDTSLINGVAHDGVWAVHTEPVVTVDEVTASTIFQWDDTQAYFSIFPLPSELVLTYRLSIQGLQVQYAIKNTGQSTIPVAFALHPSFKRLSTDNTTLSIPAATVMRMDRTLLPSGELFNVSEVMFKQFDLRRAVLVNSALRLDHVYTDLASGEAAKITYPTENLVVNISASKDCQYIVLHTLGKNKTIEIEPQMCSTDAINAQDPNKAGIISLEPEQVHKGWIDYMLQETLSN